MGASGAGSPWCGPSGAGELGGREVDVLGWWGGRWGGLGGVGLGRWGSDGGV